MKTLIICCGASLFITVCLGQTSNVNRPMFTCFSQGWAGSFATNCASVSVIKLAIAKYGLYNVFMQVDTLPNKYVITLRNHQSLELTSAELATMETLNKFHFGATTDTVQSAEFMYAVMAKNKMTQYPAQYSTLTAASTEKTGWFLHHYTVYELNEDTYENFKLLGIDTAHIKKINVNDIKNYRDLIITSNRHSAYSSFGSYDEYGAGALNSDFHIKHRDINENDNYIIID